LPCVAVVGGVVERLPLRAALVLALAFGQLREQVAHAMNGAMLATCGRLALLARLDEPGRAVGGDQHRRSQPAADQTLVRPGSTNSGRGRAPICRLETAN
jgi:hypothetical protein